MELKNHDCIKGVNGWFTYHELPRSKVHTMLARIALHCKRREMDVFHSQLEEGDGCVSLTA
jgi:hypothetical protein